MFSVFESNMETEIKNANALSLIRVSNIMDASIQNIYHQATRIANNNDVIYFLSDVFDYNPGKILDMLEGMAIGSPFIDSVHLYSISDSRVISLRGGGHIDNFYDNGWHEEFLRNQERRFWFQAREVDLPTPAVVRQNSVITVFYSMVYIGNHKGAIIVNLSIDNLIDFFEMAAGETIEIFDINGYMIFPETNNGRLERAVINTPYSFISDDKSMVTTYIRSSETGWTYVSRSELTQYSRHAANFTRITYTVFGIGLLIVILLAIYVLFIMMRPVKKQEVELEVRQKLLEKAQITAMQAQISPHFLLNILTTIKFMAMKLTKGDNDVSYAVTALLDLYRVTLSGGEHLTSLKSEIEHVTRYIELQKIRFKDKFDAVFDIAPEAINKTAVKIMLQPIVENAITHGIRPIKGKGIITIKIYVLNQNLFVEVSDNGTGMNAERQAELNTYMQSDYFDDFGHIGMRNVNQRLKLIFGDEYGVSVRSKENEGTTIVLAIPATDRAE